MAPAHCLSVQIDDPLLAPAARGPIDPSPTPPYAATATRSAGHEPSASAAAGGGPEMMRENRKCYLSGMGLVRALTHRPPLPSPTPSFARIKGSGSSTGIIYIRIETHHTHTHTHVHTHTCTDTHTHTHTHTHTRTHSHTGAPLGGSAGRPAPHPRPPLLRPSHTPILPTPPALQPFTHTLSHVTAPRRRPNLTALLTLAALRPRPFPSGPQAATRPRLGYGYGYFARERRNSALPIFFNLFSDF